MERDRIKPEAQGSCSGVYIDGGNRSGVSMGNVNHGLGRREGICKCRINEERSGKGEHGSELA